MRMLVAVNAVGIPAMVFTGCAPSPEDRGLAYAAETRAEHVRFLVDETWCDALGTRRVDQEIFDAVFEVIDEAEQFVLLDFFLVNDFLYEPGDCMRPLSQELTDRLLEKRRTHPEVPIIFITDPVNTVYGSIESPQFSALQQAGVKVVWTDLDKLSDSNPFYSKPWRVLVRPLGVGPGNAISNPMGEGRISVRSMLKLLNFKANHRKLVATEKSLLVTSANPHSASSAHWNVALRVDGAGMELACESESAILRMAGAEDDLSPFAGTDFARSAEPAEGAFRVELLTERRIKERVLDLLDHAGAGARIDLGMFYLADRDIQAALLRAGKRGCGLRIILDPSKDAFGRTKNGIPNRQSAARLVKAGIPLRWADTHGEQFHVKMLYVEQPDQSATLLLGSCNYTRRNTDNHNAECSMAITAPADDESLQRARDTFDRWWSNPDGRLYTTDYAVYADPSLRRRVRAWLMETTGMSSF
ncbi:MAG: hypothetical protein JW713_05890 [Pontiellaceae bacterium]|nr:hypothetical protein [Pontiellaceae bacterium]